MQYYRTSSLVGCNVKNVFDCIIAQVMSQRKGLKQVDTDEGQENNTKIEGKSIESSEKKEEKSDGKCLMF